MQSNNLLGCCSPNPLGWVAMDFELVELPGIIFDPADWVEMLKMDAVIDSLVVYWSWSKFIGTFLEKVNVGWMAH